MRRKQSLYGGMGRKGLHPLQGAWKTFFVEKALRHYIRLLSVLCGQRIRCSLRLGPFHGAIARAWRGRYLPAGRKHVLSALLYALAALQDRCGCPFATVFCSRSGGYTRLIHGPDQGNLRNLPRYGMFVR